MNRERVAMKISGSIIYHSQWSTQANQEYQNSIFKEIIIN